MNNDFEKWEKLKTVAIILTIINSTLLVIQILLWLLK